MIRLDKVEKVYRAERVETLALQQVSLDVKKGEFVSVMGPSGCGKSTLLNIMGLLDNPSGGQVHIDGEEVTQLQEKKLARLRNEKIGFIFQSFHLIRDLCVRDNVEIPLLYRGISGKTRRKLAEAALEKVGLASRMDHFPGQLSGGQQQRVAIARAVVGKPTILLADEPTGNLDSHMGEEIMGLLADLNEKDETTIVMVTHDEQQAGKTHRIVRMFDGQRIN